MKVGEQKRKSTAKLQDFAAFLSSQIRMGNQGMTRLLVLCEDIGMYKDFTFPIQHPALFHRTETEEICLIKQPSRLCTALMDRVAGS